MGNNSGCGSNFTGDKDRAIQAKSAFHFDPIKAYLR